jgi:hypothetical protein
MSGEADGKTITYKYTRHPDYRTTYANGAIGGTTPRGDVKFDLFVEFVDIPEQSVHSITPDGIGPEIERQPANPPLTRQSQVGVIMSPSQAKSLAYWLLSQTNTLEQKQGAPNGDPKIDLQGDQEGDARG